ncbi:MAG: FKBP-type peptidyl-prolyl cis-trans isomerase [Clostridium sp.]|nr:FKBP-type peptidyl-prolyl cis-trans isomerase [Clostridium sp.]
MKKLFLACGVAMTLFLASSCGGNGSSDADKSFADSVSTIYGKYNGMGLNLNFSSLPTEEKAHYSKAGVVRGFKEVILADTSDLGYYTGLNIALQMNNQLMQIEKQGGIHIDRAKLLAEFSKAFMADTVSETDMTALGSVYNNIMAQVQSKIMQKQEADRVAAEAAAAAASQANIEEGEAFFAKLKEDKDVKFTESGLAYKVVKEGEGANATANSKVTLNYTGSLINGTEFDKSQDPVTFVPSQTVPGFSEGLQLMNAGSHYILYIPSNLGYGDRNLPTIPANSTLIFDVEVISIAE